jgi:hypothetical protein
MSNSTALSTIATNPLTPPEPDLSALPARLAKRLWVTPTEFLLTIRALVIAEWAIRVSHYFLRRLPEPSRRGPKQVYADSSVLLMALIQVAWQMGYETIVDYFRAHPEAARAAGFVDGRVIRIGQYWERRRALGIGPFWFFFIGMVWQLVRMKVIHGADVVLDSTTQQAWFHDDPDAHWSFPKPWKDPVWGYKVHTLLCRWSELPVMFLVTPANWHDSPLAIPLLSLAVAFFAFPIAIVRADAAYFSYALLNYIHSTLHAGSVIDYNLRKRGKKAIAALFFIHQWRFHMKFRTVIERHFAWAKRYFGLETARWKGLVAAYQHTALVYSVMLGVALTAHRFQRPDLAGSRMKVLAINTPA